MPKSTRYRHNKTVIAYERVDAAFRAVDDAWNITAPPPTAPIIVPHPYSPEEPWTHTLTYQYQVTVPGSPPVVRTLRGHVHYNNLAPLGVKKLGPGYFWVSGINGYDARTPEAVVTLFEGVTWT